MSNSYQYRLDVFKRASLCRNFEQHVFELIKKGVFKIPIYLSAGQEYIPASIAECLLSKNIEPNIFIQHRGHSTYLSYEAPIEGLINELLGKPFGCTNGMLQYIVKKKISMVMMG